MDKRPIALFDSGLGGLTVLEKLSAILPNENYIYFGDTARVPYGSKSKETIINYSKEITNFLIKQNVKMIIIACGTASSLAFDELKKSYDVPIFNVITPASKKIKGDKIGVIATSATIKSKAWEKTILKYNSKANIFSKSCPLFVPIVEEGLAKTTIADSVIDLYLKNLKNKNLDSLVLGCTHYPILYNKIKKYMGSKTNVINVNEACAKEVKNFLTKKDMLNNSKTKPYKYAYVTDSTSSFKNNSKTFCKISFDKITKVKFK